MGSKPPHGNRVSDAEKEKLAEIARQAYVGGYLTQEELSSYAGQIWAARVEGDLDKVAAGMNLPAARFTSVSRKATAMPDGSFHVACKTKRDVQRRPPSRPLIHVYALMLLLLLAAIVLSHV